MFIIIRFLYKGCFIQKRMIIIYNMATGGTEPLAMAATTIDRPSYGYPDMYNFFDPDNFLTLSAVLGSGDPYLQQQVHKPCLSPQQLVSPFTSNESRCW